MVHNLNLQASCSSQDAEVVPQTEALNKQGISGLIKAFLKNYFDAHEGHLPTSGLYERIIQEVERPLFEETLKLVTGNQKKAAEILGINRNTLRKKLTELGIDPKEL